MTKAVSISRPLNAFDTFISISGAPSRSWRWIKNKVWERFSRKCVSERIGWGMAVPFASAMDQKKKKKRFSSCPQASPQCQQCRKGGDCQADPSQLSLHQIEMPRGEFYQVYTHYTGMVRHALTDSLQKREGLIFCKICIWECHQPACLINACSYARNLVPAHCL